MPVTIIRNPSPMRVSNRSKPFNAAVRALAPRIAEVRKEGARTIEEIMKALSARGTLAPSGKPFTYTTTHRVLKRLVKLGLGDGPQSLSQAHSERRDTGWRGGRAASLKQFAVQHPDAFKELEEEATRLGQDQF